MIKCCEPPKTEEDKAAKFDLRTDVSTKASHVNRHIFPTYVDFNEKIVQIQFNKRYRMVYNSWLTPSSFLPLEDFWGKSSYEQDRSESHSDIADENHTGEM